MTKQEMLNGMSEAEFYALYPTKETWQAAQQEMAYGGSPFIQGFPFGAGITMANGGTPYYGGPIRPAKFGGLPGGINEENPCYDCGGSYMEDGGNASPFNYGAFPAMQNGGAGYASPIMNAQGNYGEFQHTDDVKYYKDEPIEEPGLFGGLFSGAGGGSGSPMFQDGAESWDPQGDNDRGNFNAAGFSSDPYAQEGGDPAKIWLAQQQLALQNRTRQGIPAGVKPTGTNPLNFNPYLKGSDISQPDSIHTNPFDPRIAAYFKGNKMIAGPADNSGQSINAARKVNTGKFYKKDDEIFPDYVSQRAYGGAFDPTNNQDYPILDNGGNYDWINETISAVNKRKKGGDTTEQGGNQDFLTKRNEYVKNYMKNMVEKNIRQEESEKVKNAFIQMDSQMPPVGAPPMAYGGYMQRGGGPGINYHQAYDQVNERNYANAMAAQNQLANLNNNRTEAWQRMFGSFGDNSLDPNNFYAQDGKIVQNKDESWEDYHARQREAEASQKGGAGRVWDGTKWVLPAAATTRTSQGYNPWGNLAEAGNPAGQYSNYIPDNDIRTGFRFGKKDFKELSNLDPNITKASGVQVNYNRMGRLFPGLVGPKSVTIGTVDMSKGAFEGYNPSGQNQNIQKQNRSQPQVEESYDDMNRFEKWQDNRRISKMERATTKKNEEIAKIGPEAYKANQAWDKMSWQEKRASKKAGKAALNQDENMFNRMEENKKNQGEIIHPDYGSIPAGTMIDNSGRFSKSVKPFTIENNANNVKAYGGYTRQAGGNPISMDAYEESIRFKPPIIEDNGNDEMPPSMLANEEQPIDLNNSAAIAANRDKQYEMFGAPADAKPDIMGAPGKSYTATKKTTGVGKAALKRSALIADTWSSALEENQSTAKQRQKNMTYAMNKVISNPNDVKQEGDYDINTGEFRSDQKVPVQFAGYAQWGGFNTMQNGGINMRAGLYGTNGNNQFTHNAHLESGKISQQPTETRDTLQPVAREGANLEAERGETAIVNIDGMPAHFKIGGKRHSEGGTPLNLPDNSFIFSDTAKMKIKDPIILAQFGMVPKKAGYTPAEIAKKYNINKFRKTLAEPNSEKLDRDTAEMMISNYNLKLAKLAMIQESAKGFPQGIPVIAMPYIMENEIDPSTFLPDQAQEQEEAGTQPDAEMGVARYGANVIAEWNRKFGGGLPFAQDGGQGEEPGFWSKVGHGVLDVLEAPQKAMMYAGTGLFGDREYEIQNAKGETKWVSEDNLPLFTKPNAKGEVWVPTGQTDKAHYEMPGETLKRTHPQSNPILQGALDIVADPFLVTGLAKSGARLAVKKITEEAAEQAVKGTLKNTTIAKGVQSVLLNSGKKATVKNIKIAEKAIDAAQKSVDAGKAAKAFTTARKAGASELMKQDLKAVGKATEKYLGKPIADAARATVKGAKYVGEKAVELAKNIDVPSLGPLGAPLVASAARNVGNMGLKEDLAKSKAENIRLKESLKTEKPSYRPLRTENGIGVFSNSSTPGAEYMFQNGQYVPYTPARRDSVLVAPPKGKKDTLNYDNMSVEELQKLLGE